MKYFFLFSLKIFVNKFILRGNLFKAIKRESDFLVCVIPSLTQMTCVKRIPGEGKKIGMKIKGRALELRFIYPVYRFFHSLSHTHRVHHPQPTACDKIENEGAFHSLSSPDFICVGS
jgi:hypothetical protein